MTCPRFVAITNQALVTEIDFLVTDLRILLVFRRPIKILRWRFFVLITNSLRGVELAKY